MIAADLLPSAMMPVFPQAHITQVRQASAERKHRKPTKDRLGPHWYHFAMNHGLNCVSQAGSWRIVRDR